MAENELADPTTSDSNTTFEAGRHQERHRGGRGVVDQLFVPRFQGVGRRHRLPARSTG